MATRVKMLKLLLESRGLAELAGQRPHTRPPGPLMLQLQAPGRRATTARRRYTVPVDMQDPPDIPHPVTIIYLTAGAVTEPDCVASS